MKNITNKVLPWSDCCYCGVCSVVCPYSSQQQANEDTLGKEPFVYTKTIFNKKSFRVRRLFPSHMVQFITP